MTPKSLGRRRDSLAAQNLCLPLCARRCLESGRSVRTSNKRRWSRPTAQSCWPFAKEHSAAFLFEASVGGGTPIITPMHQCRRQTHNQQHPRHRQRHDELHADEDEARENMGFDEAP